MGFHDAFLVLDVLACEAERFSELSWCHPLIVHVNVRENDI